jgi:hypothetical protein
MGSTDEKDYATIKVPDKDDTYLETMSGKELANAGTQQRICTICGLSARSKVELQDHIRNAHREACA